MYVCGGACVSVYIHALCMHACITRMYVSHVYLRKNVRMCICTCTCMGGAEC